MTAQPSSIHPHPTPDRFATTGRLVTILTIVAIAIGAIVIAVAIWDEPLHIDELRQVKMYERSFRTIALDAFEADQPPLDHWLNAVVRRVIGIGDVRQRLLSAIWGVISLILVALLARRRDLRVGVPIAVLFVGISPALVVLTPYARPYALPVLLGLVFVLAVDIWLESREPWAASALVLSALFLPWSRTADPTILLISATVALLIRRFALGRSSPGSIWLPVSAALAAIALVGIPVTTKLPRNGYAGAPGLDGLPVLWERFPQAWVTAVPMFLVIVGLGVALLLIPTTRRKLLDWWWLWALVGVPIGFALAYALTADTTVGYLARYGFSWVIPIGFLLGLASCWALGRLTESNKSMSAIAVSVAVVAVLGATAWTLAGKLSTQSSPDWDQMATEVEMRVGPYTTLLFHDVLSFGANWTTFAGEGRYLDPRYRVDSTMQIARSAEELDNRGPVVVITFREPLDAPGWTRSQIDRQAWIYFPDTEVLGVHGVVDTLLAFADATTPWRGAGLVAAAASIVASEESIPAGCAILEPLHDEPGLHQAVLGYAEDYGRDMVWMLDCRSG